MACKVHKVRFYNPKPRAINSVAFNKAEKWLAISREDASIEIWDVNHAPYLLKWIPGVEKGSVEALGWVQQRLLSTGLGGALVEWDLDSLTSKWSAVLTGYAAWCLAVDVAQRWVAVGTEQGYLNLFRVQADRINYEKLFDKQEGRIICCQFDKTGNILVTGSLATIRIWDVATGHARHRLAAGRRGRDCLVWSVAVLSDLTVVAGDSDGRLTFWDGNVAEQIESFATHKADVLAVVVSADERTVYCSGVEPAVVAYSRVARGDGGARDRWVKSLQRHVHEHDVRALAVQGSRLISMGADGYLALSSYPPKWLLRVPPLPPAPRIAAAVTHAQHKLLLLRYTSHLEVWRLGKYSTSEDGNPIFSGEDKDRSMTNGKAKGKVEVDSASLGLQLLGLKENNARSMLELSEQPLKLVSIRSKGNQQIKCCALSPNGQFVMYATDETVRVFNLDLDGEEPYLLKLPVSAPGAATCTRAAFTSDSRTLLLHSLGALSVLHVDSSTGATLHYQIPTSPYLKEGCALHLTTATATESRVTYAVCADTRGAVAVWARQEGVTRFQHHVTLPRYKCVPSALAVCPATENLLIVYVDQKLVEYDLKQRKFNTWPDKKLPRQWRERSAAVTCVAPHPLQPQLLLFHDDTSLWLLNKGHLLEEENSEPISKKKAGSKKEANIKVIPLKYLAGWAWLGDAEALAVQVMPEHIISQLPPALDTGRSRLQDLEIAASYYLLPLAETCFNPTNAIVTYSTNTIGKQNANKGGVGDISGFHLSAASLVLMSEYSAALRRKSCDLVRFSVSTV